MSTSLRVDIIVPFFLGIIFHFGKINNLANWFSNMLNQKYLSQKLTDYGFKKGDNFLTNNKSLTELTTNDSAFME